jgi:hypothetical protein
VLQPCCIPLVLPVISYIKALSMIYILVYSNLHISYRLQFHWQNYLLLWCVSVLNMFFAALDEPCLEVGHHVCT